MADCALGQPSWRANFGTWQGYGHTPEEACSALGATWPNQSSYAFSWTSGGCSQPSGTAVLVQVCSPPEIKPGEVGPVTLTAACPASAPCVFSMFTDGSIPTQITPSATVTAMAFGLGAVLSFFAIGYVIGVATGLIKKA